MSKTFSVKRCVWPFRPEKWSQTVDHGVGEVVSPTDGAVNTAQPWISLEVKADTGTCLLSRLKCVAWILLLRLDN